MCDFSTSTRPHHPPPLTRYLCCTCLAHHSALLSASQFFFCTPLKALSRSCQKQKVILALSSALSRGEHPHMVAERSEMSDILSDDKVGTAVPAVSAVGYEVHSRLNTRLMGKPEKFARQDALWLDWKFPIEACFGVLGCVESLQRAELEKNPVTINRPQDRNVESASASEKSIWPLPCLTQHSKHCRPMRIRRMAKTLLATRANSWEQVPRTLKQSDGNRFARRRVY